MKAIVQTEYGSADVLRYTDIDQPAYGDDDVLVRVHAAGVDPGIWHVMTGTPYLTRVLGFGVRAPKVRVRGVDVAGTVEAVGANVTRFQIGDEVFGMSGGGFAEFARARQDRLVRKPASLSFEQAAVIPTSGVTAAQAVRTHGKVQAGQRVLVIGAAGGVGSFAVQLAKALGAHVTGVCSTAKVELVRSIGADAVIDYTVTDLAGSGETFDLIVDTAGSRSLTSLRRSLTPKGTLVIVGGETDGRLLGGADRSLRAVMLSPFVSQSLRGMLAQATLEDLEFLAEQVESGALRPVVDRSFPLSEAADAIRYLSEGHATGKVVVTV